MVFGAKMAVKGRATTTDMNILVIGDDNFRGLPEVERMKEDACVVVRGVEEALEAIHDSPEQSLVLVVDEQTKTFYTLLTRLQAATSKVKLLFLNPNSHYYMVGDTNRNVTINYYMPSRREQVSC